MDKKERQKLCWNCEANVAFQDLACPYCGVSLDVSPLAGTGQAAKKIDVVETASYKSSSLTTLILALSFLMMGTSLVLFSFILFFFSDGKETFTLHWSASLWFVYLFVGLPIMYLGWKQVNRLEIS